MKTPEEIKKGLRWCGGIRQMIDGCSGGCPYYMPEDDGCKQEDLHADALALIQQLEADKIRLLEESHEMRKDMLGKIQQLEAQVPRWISVEERLPEDQRYVLTVNGHGAIRMMGLWKKDGDKWTWLCNGRMAHFNDITHWMPLPQPPKEDET